MRRADGSLDHAGFRGGPADLIRLALEEQAPWLEAARKAPRAGEKMSASLMYQCSTSLMRATRAGDERRVRELLAAGAPPFCVVDGWTALHLACSRGNARIVAALLEADASGDTVNVDDGFGCTPLVLASAGGHEGAVRALLARGALLDRKSRNGWTALHWAAQNRKAGVLGQLCAAPGAAAALAMRTVEGRTPLAIALANGECACSAVLRAHGAS